MTASVFEQLGQYANSPGIRAYCYAALAVSFTVLLALISPTHKRDDQTELARGARLKTKMVYLRIVNHLSNNPAQHKSTSVMCQMM